MHRSAAFSIYVGRLISVSNTKSLLCCSTTVKSKLGLFSFSFSRPHWSRKLLHCRLSRCTATRCISRAALELVFLHLSGASFIFIPPLHSLPVLTALNYSFYSPVGSKHFCRHLHVATRPWLPTVVWTLIISSLIIQSNSVSPLLFSITSSATKFDSPSEYWRCSHSLDKQTFVIWKEKGRSLFIKDQNFLFSSRRGVSTLTWGE